ncbi:hypothetical protein [Primorskyibacter sp. 2E233]|uniref:hypothetical protein n=1 Tax=Primorskyibacter sp. 2E233 TaxID=3413431 RepID=UPI003BF44C86
MSRPFDLCQRLTESAVPSATLPATDGREIDLGSLPGCPVLYAYPRARPPGETAIPGWDEIPGAKGRTPQSCGYRDHHADLLNAGAAQVFYPAENAEHVLRYLATRD